MNIGVPWIWPLMLYSQIRKTILASYSNSATTLNITTFSIIINKTPCIKAAHCYAECHVSAISNGRETKSCLGPVFNSKLGRIDMPHNKCMAWHPATHRVENSEQGSSCHLKFVHGFTYKPVILSFIMLSVVMLSAVAPKAGPNALALSRKKETSQYETGAEITTIYSIHNLPKGSIS